MAELVIEIFLFTPARGLLLRGSRLPRLCAIWSFLVKAVAEILGRLYVDQHAEQKLGAKTRRYASHPGWGLGYRELSLLWLGFI